ncbi:unnamed protein product [Mytilus edulis]|uniref:Endonuclease/exonuclease/phosphatase domain-containing protein n=1 Tax=Mytilus edulis TaxID=6550 RepID=A0A8S3TY67_MYTED|nr:unnamed protein product [Mytilus edulis]
MYTHLLEGIVKYSKLGDILIQGDFNAYTNTMPDFIVNDEKSHSSNDDVFYKFDISLPRNNLDNKRINNSGKHLLNMCKESGLRILNGRTTCDLFGRPTCITYNGCSLVDYSIVSNELFNSVGFFQVHEFTALSNHCPIVCGILSNIVKSCNFSSKLEDLPGKFIWSDEAIELYKTNIQSKNIKDKFNNFIQKDFGEVNEMVGEFNSILIETANMSTKFIKRGKPKRNKSNKTQKNHGFLNRKDLRISVKNYEKLVNKFPFNAEYRKSFYTFRSRFRRRCKYEEKQYKEKICNELDNCVESNPKVFWKLINKLDQSSTCKTNESLPYNSFKEHFEKLTLEHPEMNRFQENVTKIFESLKAKLPFNNDINELNGVITPSEVVKAIKSLKNGKSPSIDFISNEMIKNGTNSTMESLVKLFNIVFNEGIFPKIWNESLLVPLHKKGSKADPGNYRGISISSNLGKVFNKIIHARLLKFTQCNNLISIEINY